MAFLIGSVCILLFGIFIYYFFLAFWLAYNKPFNVLIYVGGFIFANVVMYYFLRKNYVLLAFLSYNFIVFASLLLSANSVDLLGF